MKNSQSIPFISSSKDFALAEKYFGDAALFHASVISSESAISQINKKKLWLHTSFELFHKWPNEPGAVKNSPFKKLAKYKNHNILTRDKFSIPKDGESLKELLYLFLNDCISYNPKWLSVPQVAYVKGAAKNKINKCLAEYTREWASEHKFKGELILPVILTHRSQINTKPERDSKIKIACDCYSAAGANAIWIVDSSLDDQSGTKNIESKSFNPMIEFHHRIKQEIGDGQIIGGPYWALNFILWARGLSDYCAIPTNATMRYFLPGKIWKGAETPTRRIALTPLRRLSIVDSHLKEWLSSSVAKMDKNSDNYTEMKELKNSLPQYSTADFARNQVMNFYREWFDSIERHPAPGRALALFQDLTRAYATGKVLPNFTTSKPKQPERVAHTFMVSCL